MLTLIERRLRYVIVIALAFGLLGHHTLSALAQTKPSRPIDMMIVIDNSCSMFPKEKALAVCEAWGNDPEFLRIMGADLFIARLGFSEVNEAEYQAGVIGLGKTPRLISSLQPLSGARDTLARAIANPSPETATGIIPALEMAYRELRESPSRRATNLPAVVLITDGIPYPIKGQTNAEIEKLVAQNPDIPLFIMLLQNPTAVSPGYEEYIRFWGQLQNDYTHVRTYPIADADQIEETYNAIIAQLQSTIPSEGIGVAPGAPLQVFVSRYVQRIILTIIHDPDVAKGTVTITDPTGQPVADGQAGVSHFRGTDNPVEVVSIFAPRLEDDLKEDLWTVASDVPVIVFLDRQGAYRVNFLAPAVSLTDVTNIYLATERWNPNKELVIRFNLVDDKGQPITEPQPIQGDVTYPDGTEVSLRIPADLQPDAAGTYEVRSDLASAYPAILTQPGRFTFSIDAGSADDRSAKRIPIANALLLVDAGRGCYVEQAAPQPLVCKAGQPAGLSVTLGDIDTCRADTLRVRVLSSGDEVELAPGAAGVFAGDVSALCTALLSSLTCSTQQDTTFRVRMVAERTDGAYLAPSEQEVQVQVVAADCPPPTPTDTPVPPTPTPTPPPTPTPCPDRDKDGQNDCGQDDCPDQPGIARLQGCPIPWWWWLVGALLLVGLLAFIVFWLWPRLKVVISPPPKASVEVHRGGTLEKQYSISSVGKTKHTNRVIIGSDPKKAHIVVKDLKPAEFVVQKEGDRVVLLDVEKKTTKAFFSEFQMPVSTSATDVMLRIILVKAKQKAQVRKQVRP